MEGKKKEKRKSNLRINSKEGKQTFPQTNKISANEKVSLLRLKFNHRKDFIVTRRIIITTQERRGLSFCLSAGMRLQEPGAEQERWCQEGKEGLQQCPTSN